MWVIAETTDLPTRYAKMVVTDDQGRYVVPDLPKAKYKVWVRGYGLVDSPKVDGEPGKQLDLKAVAAPNEAAAAQYYPAIYWYSMLKIPDASQFGGKSDIPEKITQAEWLTRDQEPGLRRLPSARPAVHAHDPGGVRRVQVGRGRLAPPHQSGQAAPLMIEPAGRLSRRRAVSSISATGPIASPRASCRTPSRRGRKASSATSSSRPGTGATRSNICTI